MFPLFETICIQDGQPLNLVWHQNRLESSYQSYYQQPAPFDLTYLLKQAELPLQKGVLKLRFEYNQKNHLINRSIYHKKEISKVVLVDLELADLSGANKKPFDYSLKYCDRSIFEQLIVQHPDASDIIIVQNSFITDTTIANILFFDGLKWVTPDTPLLKGTCRSRLLSMHQIQEQQIRVEDLNYFKGFQLINAMRGFNPNEILPMRFIST